MTRRNARSLAARLMTAQAAIIVVGSLTLALTAALVAPGLFHRHLSEAGVSSASVRRHAEQAFASSLAISLTVAALSALITAGVASWILVRRVVEPVEQLALAADAVAAGRYDVRLPLTPFSSELESLSGAFSHMASRLAETDATRSRLLSDLSHELRTPLATLSACIDAMEDGVLPADAASWETLRGQVSRLHRLATDVRFVAAAEEQSLGLRPGPTDLVALAASAVVAATPRYATRSVHLAYHGDQAAAEVRADPERLGQVLSNLLDNAFRHTPPGGHVTVGVETRTRQVLLHVDDDGDGIPPDQLEAIFERFHRVDPARAATDGRGSGLGLTIARAIVHAHGGTLTATSAGPGRGADFTVALPRTDGS
jgi:two-component system, OmpR family, sensor histidine kinase BaeS